MTLRHAVAIILVACSAPAVLAGESAEHPRNDYYWRAHVDLMQGDTAKAIADLEQAIAHAPEHPDERCLRPDTTRRRIALLHESRGEWRQAMQRWTEWDASAGADCGNGAAEAWEEKRRAIARCRFHLGEVDAAIEAVRSLVWFGDPLNGRSADSVALYAELCARSGRMEEARRTIEQLPGGSAYGRNDPQFLASLALGEAYARDDVASMLAALRPFEPAMIYGKPLATDPEFRLAARFLVGMGGAAIATLSDAIHEGDAHAIVLAGLMGDARLLAPLEEHLRSSDGGDERTSQALLCLRNPRPDEP